MKKYRKGKLVSIIPSILFFIATLFLILSPLTLKKAIETQNEIFVIFIDELKENNLESALFSTFNHIFFNVLWILIVFMLIASLGFVSYIHYHDKVDDKILLVSNIFFLSLILLLTNSIVGGIVMFSFLLEIVCLSKTYEPNKKVFGKTFSIISSKLNFMSIFLGVALLITILSNLESFEQTVAQSNLRLISNLVPNMTQIKEIQKLQIDAMAEGFEMSLKERYDLMPQQTKEQCSLLYETMIEGIESYRNRSKERIEQQEINIQDTLSQFVPFLSVINKSMPLLVALTGYAIVSFLAPFIAAFVALIYSLVKRR